MSPRVSASASSEARVALFASGAFAALAADVRATLIQRGASAGASASAADSVRSGVAQIIADVRERGDTALREMAARWDGVALDAIEVPKGEWTRALETLPRELRAALDHAARNITAVHEAFRPVAAEVSPEPGITVGRRPDPLARVGVYAPGGRAAYPSSLLMGAIPARVAGVGEVIVCSPPGPNGMPSTVVLAAAALAGVDRVFAVGGAGAIAAMALGTATIPRVDRIVGPGNAFVAEAKLQLTGAVAIDSPAGPSELLVIADDTASAGVIAREMAAQAEHDPDAAVIALLAGPGADALHGALLDALDDVVRAAPRADIIRSALASRGAVLTCGSIETAVEFANAWAAEHLLLIVDTDIEQRALARLRAAGTIFLGASSSVAFGDYMTGANHVLPTAGLARCYSGLSTLDFVRWTTWQRVTPAAAASLADDVGVFADAEGLPAHAATARAWGIADAARS